MLTTDEYDIELSNASIIDEQYENDVGLECVGSLKRESGSEGISDYLFGTEYIGAKIHIDDIDNHNYLVCYGKKILNHGQPRVFVFDKDGKFVGSVTDNYDELDNEWRKYVIDLSDMDGEITIIFNGGYIDNTGSSSQITYLVE